MAMDLSTYWNFGIFLLLMSRTPEPSKLWMKRPAQGRS
jgi:hypothetical protein